MKNYSIIIVVSFLFVGNSSHNQLNQIENMQAPSSLLIDRQELPDIFPHTNQLLIPRNEICEAILEGLVR